MTIHEIQPTKAHGIICIKSLCEAHGTENHCQCPICKENMREKGATAIEMRHGQGWILKYPDGREEIIRK